MKTYKASLSWKHHIKCGLMHFYIMDKFDNKTENFIGIPPEGSTLECESMGIVLVDELKEWLDNEGVDYSLSNHTTEKQYIYFSNSIDAIKFKMTFDNIGEIVEEEV